MKETYNLKKKSITYSYLEAKLLLQNKIKGKIVSAERRSTCFLQQEQENITCTVTYKNMTKMKDKTALIFRKNRHIKPIVQKEH